MNAYWHNVLESCTLCPRNCRVNRRNGQIGYCHETADLSASRASLHMWEEPCLSGKEGAGTVFFTGCNLRCIYCQNAEIADGNHGTHITPERLAEIFTYIDDPDEYLKSGRYLSGTAGSKSQQHRPCHPNSSHSDDRRSHHPGKKTGTHHPCRV